MWFTKIRDTDDSSTIIDALNFYESELEEGRKELNSTGNIEKISLELPGIIEYRFAQLQDIESILEHFNIKKKKMMGDKYKFYVEKHSKLLKSKDIEFYIGCDDEIIGLENLINTIAHIRNRYLSLIKGLEAKTYQLNNITRLRCAGLDDSEIKFSYIKF